MKNVLIIAEWVFVISLILLVLACVGHVHAQVIPMEAL